MWEEWWKISVFISYNGRRYTPLILTKGKFSETEKKSQMFWAKVTSREKNYENFEVSQLHGRKQADSFFVYIPR